MADELRATLAAAALLAAPGPTNALLATASALRGRSAALPLVGAALGGYATSITTLACILHLFPGTALATALRGFAAATLAVLAVRAAVASGADAPTRQGAGWREIAATALVNPKALVLALGISERPRSLWPAAGVAIAASIVATGAAWVGAGGWLRGAGARHARRASVALLAGFSLYLAATCLEAL